MFSSMKKTFAENMEITLNPSHPVTRMGADRLTNGSLEPPAAGIGVGRP